MSTSRGSQARKRPQKYQNRTVFKNDLHDTSHKTKLINSLEITGVCKRCKDIIEWKIKYKKYKPLLAPRKCVTCAQKTVKHAYHMLCAQCARDKHICAKCCKSIEDAATGTDIIEDNQDLDLKALLKDLPERKRRTLLRHINKQDGQQNVTPEIKAQIEDMLSKMVNVDLDDFSDENSLSDSDEQSI